MKVRFKKNNNNNSQGFIFNIFIFAPTGMMIDNIPPSLQIWEICSMHNP